MMMNFLIGLGALLILGILFLIFRVGNLVSIAKGAKSARVGPKNSLHGVLFIIFTIVSLVGFFWYSYTFFDAYTLPVSSIHGAKTDHLFWITMGVTVVAFAIISIVMFVFIYQY